jgi:tetratricopeptide (TPR) repeat protein
LIVGDDGRVLPPVALPAPGEILVVEGSDLTLSSELRWYLEEFPTYPFSPNAERGERVMDALRDWGRTAFEALFDRDAGNTLANFVSATSLPKAIQIESIDPRVLSWPWEALQHSKLGFLAHHVRITRRLTEAPAAPAVSADLPRDRINILLVISRPKQRDVGYRSISRPLVELIARKNLPAAVHVLRPPTLKELRTHLKDHRNTYHVLHFDGHGGYGGAIPSAERDDVLRGGKGKLLFEKEDGTKHDVPPETLSQILREHKIPAVVLNACQSAMVDDRADDAFASVAAGLLQAGVRSVVAMGYSLYVSGAQRFLPAFYMRLFKTGDLQEAVRAGRQSMEMEKKRLSAAGEIEFNDWLVPVHYHQASLLFSFGDSRSDSHLVDGDAEDPGLPEEGQERGQTVYGFVGRDEAILAIERAMRRPPAGVLIHGLGGVGKTSLAWEVLSWLKHTGGLSLSPVWFNFDNETNADAILNHIGVAFYGEQFRTVTADLDTDDAEAKRRARLQKKVDLLVEPLKQARFVIVWDNFESATGFEEAEVEPLLDADDQQTLKDLLTKLRGGKTKVLITSRSPEDWLGPRARYKLPLTGLQDEDRWRLTRAILRDLGKTRLQEDKALADLVDELQGHPLAMQALLPQLESMSPQALRKRLQDKIASLDTGDSLTDRLFATLRFVEDSIPQNLRPLLIPLSMHERFLDADDFVVMCEEHSGGFGRTNVDRLLTVLTTAGLVQNVDSNIYSVHPMLTRYLRETGDEDDEWTRACVDVMSRVADTLAPKPLHEQRGSFFVHEANFIRALAETKRFIARGDQEDGLRTSAAALTHSLAAYAQNTRQWDRAETLYEQLASIRKRRDDEDGVAGAYHHLGRVAEERHDLEVAARWYKKALEIKERRDNQIGAAKTYNQLGIVALERHDLEAAERWYKKALAIFERLEEKLGAAKTYHNLGNVAKERHDLEAAERWYKKALEIEERRDNQIGAAKTYHQLGIVAQERRDLEAAERWYKKALEIEERRDNQIVAAKTYGQLGIVAEERHDLEAAERWYMKALEIEERRDNQIGAAKTYHNLGNVAKERHDLEAAERWYKKALEIKERRDNQIGAAKTYHNLGIVAALKEDFLAAGGWIMEGLVAFVQTRDGCALEHSASDFLLVVRKAPEHQRKELRAMWVDAGLPEEHIDAFLRDIETTSTSND